MDLREPAYANVFAAIEKLTKGTEKDRIEINRGTAIVIQDFLVAGAKASDALDRAMNAYEDAAKMELKKADRELAFAREFGIDHADHIDPQDANRMAREKLFLYADHLYEHADRPDAPTRAEMDAATRHVLACLLTMPTIKARKKKRPSLGSVATSLRSAKTREWVRAHWAKDLPPIDLIRVPSGR